MQICNSAVTFANYKEKIEFAKTHLGIPPDEYEDTVPKLTDLVLQACSRISESPFDVDGTYVGHSGGKDSVLVAYLFERVSLNPITIVHTPKTEGDNKVHADTKNFLYGLERPILYVPSCLHGLRTELRTQIDGTRIAEATRDDGRSVTFERDGKQYSRDQLTEYVANGLFGLNFIFPIYDWSDTEVWVAILSLDIPFSSEYVCP